jgi:LysR family transcriptional activator of nhaA
MNTNFNYHHLRYFLAVATSGGITSAAAALRVSAPTLSAQVKELESFFAKPLFRREGRRMVLTEAGRLLMHYAERIFSMGDEMLEIMRRGNLPGPGTVFIGVSDAVPKLLLARILEKAVSKMPDLKVVVREGLPQELWGALASHQIDLALATEAPPPNHPHLPPGTRIGRMRVAFAASRKIVEALGKNPDPSSMPILAPARESVLRRELEQWWAEKRITPNIRAEFDDAAAMFELAARGLGAAPVHEPVLGDVCKRYGLSTIPIRCDIQDDLFVVADRRQYLGDGAQALVEISKEILKT